MDIMGEGPRHYRHKPIELDAIVWNGTNLHLVAELLDADVDDLVVGANGDLMVPTVYESDQAVGAVGDYVVRSAGYRGRGYFIPALVFRASYDDITDGEPPEYDEDDDGQDVY